MKNDDKPMIISYSEGGGIVDVRPLAIVREVLATVGGRDSAVTIKSLNKK